MDQKMIAIRDHGLNMFSSLNRLHVEARNAFIPELTRIS